MGIFDRIREGLKKTRDAVAEQAAAVFLPGHKLTDEDYETLETALLRADVGPAAAERVLEGVRKRLGDRSAEKPAEAVRAEIETVLNGAGGGAAAGAGPRPVGAAAPHRPPVRGVDGPRQTATLAQLPHP